MTRLGLSIAALGLLLGACGAPPVADSRPPVVAPAPVPSAPPVASPPPAPERVTSDAAFRQSAPAMPAMTGLTPPTIIERRLKNGIRVIHVRQPSPVVALYVVVRGGIPDVGPEHCEVVNLTLGGLRAGTATRSADAMGDEMATLFMPRPSTLRNPDAIVVSALLPASSFRESAELVSDMLMHPSFDEKRVLYTRDQYARERDADRSISSALGEAALRRMMFGKHPYGQTVGSAADVTAVTLNDIRALWSKVFVSSRVSLVAVGNLDERQITSALDVTFGALPVTTAPVPAVAPPRAPAGPRIVLVDRPGTTLAQVDLAFVGPRAGAADEPALEMAITLLADRTVGILGKKVHTEHLARSITGSTLLHASGSSRGIRLVAPTTNVALLVKEASRAFGELAEKGPPGDDLAVLRDGVAASYAGSFATAADTASTFAWTLALGGTAESLVRRPAAYAALDAAAIKAATKRWFPADQMRVVVVGDWEALNGPLSSLGWGPVERRDVDGHKVPAPGGSDARH
jgi:zinc protease